MAISNSIRFPPAKSEIVLCDIEIMVKKDFPYVFMFTLR